MQIDNETGAFTGTPIQWPAGPGLFHSTSVLDDQVVKVERLGGDGVTWVDVGASATITGNGVLNFDLDRCTLRLNMGSGTSVFADITTRRFSP